MGKYVDKATFVNFCLARGFYPTLIKRALEDMPAADVEEVRHGEWKDVGEHYCQCSICTTMFEALPTKSSFKADNIFCRHCGAKMDGERRERLNATRYRVSPDGRLEMIPTVESVKADTLKDVQMRFAMHFGTYTGDAEVKVSEVFKLLSKFAEEMLEGEI